MKFASANKFRKLKCMVNYLLDDKKIREAEKNVQNYIHESLITKNEKNKEFTDFYLKSAKTSLKVADILFSLSANMDVKAKLDLEKEFECYSWVVVCSYYSMFYAANSALSTLSIKIGDKLVHKVTLDCLLFYFLKTGKLAKYFIDEYEAMQKEALELIGDRQEIFERMQQKALELIQYFDFERNKRGIFQYKIGNEAKKSVAQTSLDRSKRFLLEMEKIILKGGA